MIFINLIILVLFILLLVKSKNYEENFVDSLDSNKYKLKPFFKIGLYAVDYFDKLKNYVDFKRQEESLKAIHVGESILIVKRLYLCNKVVAFGLVIFVFNILSIFSSLNTMKNSNLQNDYSISRPSGYGQTNNIKLDVYMTKEDIVVLTKEIDLEVQGRKYTKKSLIIY